MYNMSAANIKQMHSDTIDYLKKIYADILSVQRLNTCLVVKGAFFFFPFFVLNIFDWFTMPTWELSFPYLGIPKGVERAGRAQAVSATGWRCVAGGMIRVRASVRDIPMSFRDRPRDTKSPNAWTLLLNQLIRAPASCTFGKWYIALK